jgi:hypothetical protein
MPSARKSSRAGRVPAISGLLRDGSRLALTLPENAQGADAGFHDVIFAADARPMKQILAEGKPFKVEISFYQHGNKTFAFDPKGLNWRQPPNRDLPPALPAGRTRHTDPDGVLAVHARTGRR